MDCEATLHPHRRGPTRSSVRTLTEHRPSGALNVKKRILAVARLLLQYPYAEQATTRRGIRRIVVTPYPYIIRYRIGKSEIVVRSVRHAARRPVD